MNRREIFEQTVNFKGTKAKLTDFCGCPLSAADDKILVRLNDFLGFGKRQTYFDERMLRHYDIDFRAAGYIMAPPKPYYKNLEEGKLYSDEWGIVRKNTGDYWDIVYSPLKDKSFDEIKKYPFPDIDSLDLNALRVQTQAAKKLYSDTDYVIVSSHPVYGIFEIACWMFGFDDFLYRMAAEPETVHMFFQRYLAYQKEISSIYYKKIGEYSHITTSGDDFATQASTFTSKAMFDELIAPYFKERITYTKSLTKAKFLHHSCGNVSTLIPALIDCGVDILNPIQPCDKLMQPERLKAYGNKIVFHGGFDTQYYLPSCQPDEIERQVKNLFEKFEGCGYIFAAAHNIQNDVPIENLNAMLSAAQKYKNLYS